MTRKVRIGIDVGGTFTDAVAIDNETYEIVAKEKIPTTHRDGVARGIVLIIKDILEKNNIQPQDVVFIAHGTTQATNALLEGDVAKVGIIGTGTGAESGQVRRETNIQDIELSPGKYLRTNTTFIDSKNLTDENLNVAVTQLANDGSEVIVASGAYSVDDPADELKIQQVATDHQMLSTAGHEMSELYGLKMRTRTAVVNGSLIPKMMVTANMTEQAVKDSGISTELMIMRADGGVMSIDLVRKRPILTMLSGLAAGVAGALMYEKITDGIFFETGGTSVDISVIKNGKVMIKYAQVGGFKTYLQSLDVRTMGLAGGTMIQVKDNKIVDVGPRSAHIAGVPYECFKEAEGMTTATIKYVSPKAGDPSDYVLVTDQDGKDFSLTLCGAANLLGYVPEDDYAAGNRATTKVAWDALGKVLGTTGEVAATAALDVACAKLKVTVDELIDDYDLDPNLLTLVGGGGSASILVPYLAKKYGADMQWQIAKNAPYISTIGVALAMVRETIERNVANPSSVDIKQIRADILAKIVKAGAVEETVDVAIEIDSKKNILRAIATGATEFRSHDMKIKELPDEAMSKIAQENLNTQNVEKKYHLERWTVFEGQSISKKMFGLIKSKTQRVAVMDREGVVRFKHENVAYLQFKVAQEEAFDSFLYDHTMFSDANATLPSIMLFYKEKMVDLSGMQTKEQLESLMGAELENLQANDEVIAVAF